MTPRLITNGKRASGIAARLRDSTDAARAAELHYVCSDERGLRRVRRGPGFVYFDGRGRRVEAKYHDTLRFAETLPKLRRRLERDLLRPALDKTKVLATVVRIMEQTRIRVGKDLLPAEQRLAGLDHAARPTRQSLGFTDRISLPRQGRRAIPSQSARPAPGRDRQALSRYPGPAAVSIRGRARPLQAGDVERRPTTTSSRRPVNPSPPNSSEPGRPPWMRRAYSTSNRRARRVRRLGVTSPGQSSA